MKFSHLFCHFRTFALVASVLAAPNWAAAQTVASFTVVNADTGAEIQTFTASGTASIAGTLSIANTPRINIRANPLNTSNVKSVVFTDGSSTRTENTAPYAYKGNNGPVYYPWAPAAGTYVVNAKPFAGSGGTGTAGATATLALTVTAGPASSPQACPAPLVMPQANGCDGVLLTDSSSVDFRSAGIVATTGPGGAAALRIGTTDDQHLAIKDEACLRLGKDGTDFSVSMWLKASGNSQVIGTTSQYSKAPGFILHTRLRGDGLLELLLETGDVPLAVDPREKFAVAAKSQPFRPGEWVHVALIYDSTGVGKAATFTVMLNLAKSTGEAPINVYKTGLRIGNMGWGTHAAFDVSEVRSYARVLADTELKALALEPGKVSTLSKSELATALDRLGGHASGRAALGPAALDAELARLQQHAVLLDTDDTLTRRALTLIDDYERVSGPLFISAATLGGIPSQGISGDSLHVARTMVAVHQTVLDHVFTPTNVKHCAASLDGRRWLTSDYFPGSAPAPAGPTAERRVSINGTVPAFWGRPVAFATEPAVRPTGLYLSPGGTAEVTVPDTWVNAGFEVMVGAHTASHDNKPRWDRLPRVSKNFPITAKVTRVASPLGGGVYIRVPYLADRGVQQVSVRGKVIEAPFFSARSFDKTSISQWLTRRTAPAPWADFESDKFMMNVPSSWISAFDDPVSLMQKWDTAMDGFSEVTGHPTDKRNRTVLYQQIDTQLKHGSFGIGYPSVNNTYNPRQPGNGNADHWFLRDPTAFEVDYHELGHAHLMPKFRGEQEAIVNFPHAYIRSVKFGVDFDTAFAGSFGPSYGVMGLTPDEAAIDWMITPNFRNGSEMEQPGTTKDQFGYQQRGYAKYADVARTFGWPAVTGYFRQHHLDFMSNVGSEGLSETDNLILRLSVAAGADLRPLIHFWGIHPVDASALSRALGARGLGASPKVRALLERYATIAPKNNAEFMAFYRKRYPNGCPAGAPPDYACGWFEAWKTRFGDAEAAQTQVALRNLIALYFR